MFEGIGPKAARLVTELAVRQDKAWYAEHKPEIDALVYAPLRALLEAAKPRIERLYPRQTVSVKVFRIHRDVRFSKDKSPFKDHASGVILVGPDQEPGSGAGALYLQIGPEEGAAAGRWAMEGETLARYRRAVLQKGGEISKLLRPLLAKGYVVISAQQLARAPKGVDPAHPHANLLRHKGLALDFPPIPAKVRHSPKLLDWCVDRAAEVAPVIRWVLRHTG